MAARGDRTLGDDGGHRGTILTLLAVAVVVVAPLVPGALAAGAAAAVGLPAEALVVTLLLVAFVRTSARRTVAAVFAVVVVAAMVAAALDRAFLATIDRPFNPAEDGGALINVYGVVGDTLGPVGAAAVLGLVVVLAAAIGVALAAAAMRVGRVVGGAGRRGREALVVVVVAWIVLALAGTQLAPSAPVAASRVADALAATTSRAIDSVEEQRAFDRAVASDPLAGTPARSQLAGLAGKDVVIAFVESYGRVAVEPAGFTDGIARTLDDGGAALSAAGYSARSAFLTSPTFGGVSWLAHSTLHSGVWVDSPRKYDRLTSGERLTLARAFGDAGWHTMAVVPSNTRAWDAGEDFYGYDAVVDSRSMGYRGPVFGYARMPDQFTWMAFHDRAADAPGPLMAEVDLVSSHTPWTPLPRLVDWAELGDGSGFAAQAASGESAAAVWGDPDRVRELYAESIEYSLAATFSYLETFDQPDLVLILLGDHQPARIVSGADAGPEVPVTIIAKDAAVFDAIEAWGWDEGVHPSASAPVWRMDAFRDRFLDAFASPR
ncbi:alkaline phosphatase family protein [Microbacterium sp. HJ5]